MNKKELEIENEHLRQLLVIANWAAGKISVERKRGAGYYHAEIDALVDMKPILRKICGAGINFRAVNEALEYFTAVYQAEKRND